MVDRKKELEALSIAEAGGVENDLDGFGVPAMIAIGGIGSVAARGDHAPRNNAGTAPAQLLHAPEATAGENRALFGHRTSSTWFRYAPYPSASISSRWMNRREAELMQ